MKKKFYWGAMSLIGMLSLASCSNEDSLENIQNPVATGEQVIVLDMQDTDDLATRARPLYSTENKGAELVTDVSLFVFKIDNDLRTLVNVIPVSNWDVVSSSYNYGNKYTIKLTGDDKLNLGSNYEILAVGQDESVQSDAYQLNLTGVNAANYVSGITNSLWTETPKATWYTETEVGSGFATTKEKEDVRETEIYSGLSDPILLEVSETGAFNCTVLLKRQVAGVLGYFNQIPGQVTSDGGTTWKDVKYIRLVASAQNTQLDLSYNLDIQNDDTTHETPDEEGLEKMVNGFTSATSADAQFENGTPAYTVYEIDLTEWFVPSEGATDVWATSDYSNTEEGDTKTLSADWRNPLDPTNGVVKFQENSVFAGEFVIPFSKVASSNTFELQLLSSEDGSGNTTILKKWNVVLDAPSQTTEDLKYIYNIYRNHLYQIGQRGEGDNPDEPGTGDDKPQPLDKSQDIVIKINDQWEFIHNMGIE